ncbi:Transposase DDE domain-containing protein [Antarctobacter heliothermus]|uniref:Transposase DDE domain-containing protein n=1 Tax=Antarctobacter heliothermus TaxID=74033 RepID=A0A239LGQ6_9RHOB|nr:Transposase DDE domain-containing protein [Antarctobacter heliothermus]
MPAFARGWVDKDMTWDAPRDGRLGRPPVFSDAAIQFCLSIKVLFKLPLRQTAGMVASLLRMAGVDWPVPDSSTLCRRQKTLAVQMSTVTADGAYDTRRCHRAIIARDVIPIIPIRKNGRHWKEDCPAARARNDTLRATRHYGRAFWKRWTGYHACSRIEAKMRCLKSFGERIAARDPDRQTAEIQIRIALMNRFNALGTAEIIRVA